MNSIYENSRRKNAEMVLIGTLLMDYDATASYMANFGFSSYDLVCDRCRIIARYLAHCEKHHRGMQGLMLELKCSERGMVEQDAIVEFALNCIQAVWTSPNPFGCIAFLSAEKKLTTSVDSKG